MEIYKSVVMPILESIPHQRPTDEDLLDINAAVQLALQKVGGVAYSYVNFHLFSDRIEGHVFVMPEAKSIEDSHIRTYHTFNFTVPIEEFND